ncbi:MAG TPA: DUF4129 domain-containing protein [Stackebrandtia sp.]|jgi:hypothetical protein|uniref:DUF4129 domain-containing protein n=1 Tax=Stackebrandtia sp. TaxID=2023065 RepID=UPI002D29E639|nr:DUF4129 domain-containing protein [Stackebrandtia sp.]HZE40722.1 DUF4129 domain-containing protein [Stackebrandtia sp.]
MKDSTRRWLPIAVVTLALVLLGWVVSTAQLSSHAVPIPHLAQHNTPAAGSSSTRGTSSASSVSANAPHFSLPPWVGALISILADVIAVALAIAVVGFVAYRLFVVRPAAREAPVTRRASQPSAGEMREALLAGLSDIDAGGDPRRAVIACWLRLERAAAEAGAARLESETPSDLVVRLLTSFEVSDRALEALTSAYHRARYAPDAVGASEVERARSALTEVDAQLARAQRRDETGAAT